MGKSMSRIVSHHRMPLAKEESLILNSEACDPSPNASVIMPDSIIGRQKREETCFIRLLFLSCFTIVLEFALPSPKHGRGVCAFASRQTA